jgi:hypothetical protein
VSDSPLTFNPLNAELSPICHLLALLGAHHIVHFSRIRVKATGRYTSHTQPFVFNKFPHKSASVRLQVCKSKLVILQDEIILKMGLHENEILFQNSHTVIHSPCSSKFMSLTKKNLIYIKD